MPNAKLKKGSSLKDFQETIAEIYSKQDDRLYSSLDILLNQERFAMRAMKGIRKNDLKKLKFNLIISVTWLFALMTRYHIDLERAVRKRFPYVCSYCGMAPCTCNNKKIRKRNIEPSPKINKVKTLSDFQKMFADIYPPETRTLDHAGVHMAEEKGEISEAILAFLGEHKDGQLRSIAEEAADFYSCVMGVANSAKIDFEKEVTTLFSNGCHECHKTPCKCTFQAVMKYVS